jgi:Icc-related predicted phosphoesterase
MLYSLGSSKPRTSMNNSIEWLREMLSQPYKVITHYSPLHQSLLPEMLDALAKRISVDLQDLIKTSNISLWVHGHIHKKQDYFCGKTRIVCNPRGYSDMVEPRFNPSCIVEV